MEIKEALPTIVPFIGVLLIVAGVSLLFIGTLKNILTTFLGIPLLIEGIVTTLKPGFMLYLIKTITKLISEEGHNEIFLSMLILFVLTPVTAGLIIGAFILRFA